MGDLGQLFADILAVLGALGTAWGVVRAARWLLTPRLLRRRTEAEVREREIGNDGKEIDNVRKLLETYTSSLDRVEAELAEHRRYAGEVNVYLDAYDAALREEYGAEGVLRVKARVHVKRPALYLVQVTERS